PQKLDINLQPSGVFSFMAVILPAIHTAKKSLANEAVVIYSTVYTNTVYREAHHENFRRIQQHPRQMAFPGTQGAGRAHAWQSRAFSWRHGGRCLPGAGLGGYHSRAYVAWGRQWLLMPMRSVCASWPSQGAMLAAARCSFS